MSLLISVYRISISHMYTRPRSCIHHLRYTYANVQIQARARALAHTQICTKITQTLWSFLKIFWLLQFLWLKLTNDFQIINILRTQLYINILIFRNKTDDISFLTIKYSKSRRCYCNLSDLFLCEICLIRRDAS